MTSLAVIRDITMGECNLTIMTLTVNTWPALINLRPSSWDYIHDNDNLLQIQITVHLLKLDTYVIDNYSANMHLKEIYFHTSESRSMYSKVQKGHKN